MAAMGKLSYGETLTQQEWLVFKTITSLTIGQKVVVKLKKYENELFSLFTLNRTDSY